jgi:hypothetical protein
VKVIPELRNFAQMIENYMYKMKGCSTRRKILEGIDDFFN